jgi:UDP-N-acetylmuramate dehydrogenase
MDIKKELSGVKENILLKKYTTFKIGGPAKYFFIARKKEELIRALKIAKKHSLPSFILGNGSNVLISDKGLKGLVIKLENKNYKIRNSEIIADSGTPLFLLVREAVKRNLAGLEWAAGIPGTVGGAIRGNAGAFGKSMEDIINEVDFFDLRSFKIKKIKNRNCDFSYRGSIFKKKRNFIILSVSCKLGKGEKRRIKEKIREFLNYRKERHPKQPSAGSIFKGVRAKDLGEKFFKKFPEAKNVVKERGMPAAFLIDQCKLSGKKIGRAQISQKHPNFIVNLGGARAKDVIKLIHLIKKKVKNRFGITLEEEIQHLGF